MKDLNPVDNYLHGSWEALGNGAPILVALAQMCSERWVWQKDEQRETIAVEKLSGEAQAILYSARERGVIEVRAVNSAFDAASRLLAVYVEIDADRTIAFRDPGDPQITLRFLDGFRQLCDVGLIVHHIYKDFTLAPFAFQLAAEIQLTDVQSYLDKATEFGLHDS